MFEEVTIEMYFELPQKIIEFANKNEEYKLLLSDNYCKKYYYSNLRKEIERFFLKFNDIKYTNDLEISPNISPLYNNEKVNSNKLNDKVNSYVSKRVDDQIWAKDFYNSLLNLANKMTYEEAIYLIGSFFSKFTEEKISENLNISRNTLQKIKKSSLLKAKSEFQNIKI